MRLFILLAGILLLAGCAAPEVQENVTPVQPPVEPTPPEETMTCEEFCPTQPHIQCVGTWNISGTYPDCVCSYECEVEEAEPEEPEEEPEEEQDLEDIVQPSDKTLNQMLDEGLDKARMDFYSENDGTFEETRYTWKRLEGFEAKPGDITFDLAPINDVKFDGKGIESIQAAGFIVFEQDDYVKAYGIAVFLAQTTVLDSYTGTDAFDVEYFHSVKHRHMNDCWFYSKELSKNMNSEWVSAYSLRCESVFPKE